MKLNDSRYATFRKAIDTWGYTSQFHMAIEEMAELIKAIATGNINNPRVEEGGKE